VGRFKTEDLATRRYRNYLADKKVLYQKKLTLEGASRKLKAKKKGDPVTPINFIREIKEELKQILKILQ